VTGRKAIEVLSSDAVLAWPLVAPPGLPPKRVAELRHAFDAMVKDPRFLAEAASLKLAVNPVSGEEMQSLVDRIYEAPADVVDVIRKITSGK
jgi:hypothetical protein